MWGCCEWFRKLILVAVVLAFTGALRLTERGEWEPPQPGVAVSSTEAVPESTEPSLFGYRLSEPVPADSQRDATNPIDSAGEEFGNDPGRDQPMRGWAETVVTDWNAVDRARAGLGSWERFLQTWLDPLLRESDGWGFFDPAAYQIPSVLPVQRPREFGLGLRFRASF